ncbi:MAG: nucleotidyltransferase family protein [Chloroflexota bacterium]
MTRQVRPGARIAARLGVRPSVAAYWPRPAERPLLLAALLDDARGRAAWAAGRGELEAPVPAPGALWLRPLLAAAVERFDPDDPLLPGLRRDRDAAAARYARLVAHLTPLLAPMADAGIPLMLLKGAALVAGGVAPGGRPMGDVDLLVTPADADRALALADRPPWAPRDPVTPAFRRVWHAVHHSDGDWCHLDLHWRLFWQDPRPGAEDGLWARALPASFGPLTVLRPERTDLLVHTLLHGARRGNTSGIRWVVDAWMLLRDGDPDWDRLVRDGRERRMQVRLHRTLTYLVALLGAPVPQGVLADLRTGTTLVDRADHAFQAHGQGPLGAIPELACAFSRGHRGGGLAAWQRFPRYVADAWEVDSLAAMPAGAVRRIRRRLPGLGSHR